MTGLIGYARGKVPWRAFIESCEQNNGGVIEEKNESDVKERLAYVIDAIAHLLFEDKARDKARKDMQTFATVNEPRLYKLFKTFVDPQSDLRAIVKSRKEFLRRVEQSHASILDTFSTIVDSAAWIIINHSSIAPLIKQIQKPEGAQPERSAEVAAHYLRLIAKQCAPMYKSHTPELAIVINDKKNATLVEVALQALSAVCKWDPECAPSQKGVVERAKTLALTGTPRQAKFASRFAAYCKDAKAAPDLVEVRFLTQVAS